MALKSGAPTQSVGALKSNRCYENAVWGELRGEAVAAGDAISLVRRLLVSNAAVVPEA